MLICADTIYFGITDTVIILSESEKYSIQRNRLVRQSEDLKNDTAKQKNIQNKIELYSDVWNKAYNYSIKDTSSHKKKTINSSEIYFKQYEGKIIRSISYTAVDLFEGQVLDTGKVAARALAKSFNATHISTRQYVIRRNLRFEENQEVNAKTFSENERLLRKLSYIEDARIVINQENILSDSIDVTVITQDKFPLGLRGRMSDYNEFSVNPYVNNFLGSGDYLEAGIHFAGGEENPWGYTLGYESHNITGSFIDAGAYRILNFEKDNFGFSLERPFATTDMEYGGALTYDNVQQRRTYRHETIDTTIQSDYHSETTDVWLAKTFILSNALDIPKINVAGRLYNIHYKEAPEVHADSNMIFHDMEILLTSYMIQNISFVQTQKLAEFGATEDIPIGYSIKGTYGFSRNKYCGRPYVGFDYHSIIIDKKKCFFNFDFGIGTYFYNSTIDDFYLSISGKYIGPLYTQNRWHYRHSIQLSSGLIANERYYKANNISMNSIDINHPYYRNNSVIALQYCPTFHAPFNLLGFKFAVTPSTTFAFTSQDDWFKGKSQFYPVFGLDLKTKNESLIFPTLGFKTKYYPIYDDKRHKFVFTFYAEDLQIFQHIFSPKPEIHTP